MEEIITKKCIKCGNSGEFRDGKNVCNICAKIRSHNYYKANSEKKKIQQNKWNKENREKIKVRTKAYRDANREKITTRTASWRKANPEKCKTYDKRWYDANVEKVKAKCKRFRDANPEYGKRWYELNKEKSKEVGKKWYELNYEKHLEKVHIRRSREKGNGGKFTAREWKDLCDKYGNKCLCCGRTDVKLTVDHVVPISLGGVNTIDNIQPLCKTCNSRKHISIVDYRI